MATDDVISERAAARILARRGLSREQARRVLRTGIGGPCRSVGGLVLYPEAQVRALLDRRAMNTGLLADVAVDGVLVVRVNPSEGVFDPAQAAAGPWSMSVFARIRLRLHIQEKGAVPIVVTVAGFVVGGAEALSITGMGEKGLGEKALFHCGPAGAWYGAFSDRILWSGPGKHWTWWPGGKIPLSHADGVSSTTEDVAGGSP